MALPFLLALLCWPLHAQGTSNLPDTKSDKFVATVRVIAFSVRGRILGAPKVNVFESQHSDHRDFAQAFNAGIATGVPYGFYRIDAYLDGFNSEMRYVSVFRPEVTIVIGLAVGREQPVLPVFPVIRGRVTASVPNRDSEFVKLVGVYSSQTIESSIAPDGQFAFSVPVDGKYLLLLVDDHGIIDSLSVDSPYNGPPIQLGVSTGRPRNP